MQYFKSGVSTIRRKGTGDEWHLLKPLWMAKLSYFFASDGTWLSEEWQRFGSSIKEDGAN